MSICLCYHDEQNFLHKRGVCYGTKEKEPCSCGGNPVKCDFYEEVREKYIHRTNADRIRAMTDEELADMLTEHGFVLEWYCGKEEIKSVVYEPKQAKNKLLDWLKQEAET